MGKKIVLVSRRKQIIEFFTLEARLWGHDVCATPIFPETGENFDVLICDGVEPPDGFNGVTTYFLSNGVSDREGALTLPLSLMDLKIIFGEGDNTGEGHNGGDAIYMRENSREILYKNQFYMLTEHEYKLLEKLGEINAPVSRESLMKLLGADEGNIADVYISRLRKKLETPYGSRIIETVRGKGYKLLVKIKKYT